MKKCPYCAEEIQDEAIVCRYCGRELKPKVRTKSKIATKSGTRNNLGGCTRFAIIFGLIIAVISFLVCIMPFAFGSSILNETQSKVTKSKNGSRKTSTVTSSSLHSPTPEFTHTQQPTLEPTGTAIFQASGIVIVQNGNLRSGPGKEYSIVGYVKLGDEVQIYGCNHDGTWMKVNLNEQIWVSTSLIETEFDIASVPSISADYQPEDQFVDGTNTPIAIYTPAVSKAELPGLHPEDITIGLERLQFTCDSVMSDSFGYYWTCYRKSSSSQLRVEITSRTLSSVDCLQAGAAYYIGSDDELSTEFLGYIATAPFDGAKPQQAKTWVAQTIPTITQNGDIRTTTFGGVQVQLFGNPSFRNLYIGCTE